MWVNQLSYPHLAFPTLSNKIHKMVNIIIINKTKSFSIFSTYLWKILPKFQIILHKRR